MIQLRDKISGIYEGKISKKVLDISLPEEKFANCSECFHCIHPQSASYNTKCCTYHPHIPNYVVGAILTDESVGIKEGKTRIKNLIADRVGVTPYGIIPPPEYPAAKRRFAQTKKKTREDNEALNCPLNLLGTCTIWNYRPELCATYHCASVSGQKGGQFWKIYYRYLTHIERVLSRYVMLELNYPLEHIQIKKIKPEKVDLYNTEGQIDPDRYAQMWRENNGSEDGYYIKCYEIFDKINIDQLSTLVGLDGTLFQDKLHVQAKMSRDNILPDYLLFDEKAVEVTRQEGNLIKINGRTVKEVQYRLLKAFDGQTSTYDVIRQSLVMKANLANLARRLLDEGTLTEIIEKT